MPAGATYEPLATTTLGTAQSSITFSAISGSYTDLRLTVFVPTVNTNGVQAYFRFNGVTTTSYSQTNLAGDGSTATSGRTSNEDWIYAGQNSSGATTTLPNFYTLDLFSYAGSTNKTGLITQSADLNGSGYVARRVCLFRSTSAITSILISTSGANTFGIGTTATLYGIKAA
jgi:hypothetical protein